MSILKQLKFSVAAIGMLTACTKISNDQAEDENRTRGILRNITQDNDTFVQSHDKGDFEAIFKSQAPRALVVGCSDSRFQIETSIDFNAVNDQFVIRNIGNQYTRNKGSVAYGIKHLKTPVLIIIGHYGCGAVKAATTKLKGLETPIKDELQQLKVSHHSDHPSEEELSHNVEENVHNQVKMATEDFKMEIEKGQLDVLGAVYDFKNYYGKGYGALIFINWNGNHETKAIEDKAKALGLDKIKITHS